MKPGFLPNLARRLATAAVALPLIVLALFAGPPHLMTAIVGVAVAIGLVEMLALFRARSLRPFVVPAVFILATTFAAALQPHGLVGAAWPVGLVILLVATLVRRAEFAETVPAAAATLLGAGYLGTLGGMMAALRTLPPTSEGPWRLVLLFATMMTADTFAYLVGHAIGRHKLAPRISPGKTIEGGLGALVGGALAAVVVRQIGLPSLPLSGAIALGLGVTVLGTLGDLFESLLKRWAGVKDSGALFPGHGGMLDRLDSLLFGAPVLYYYLLYR
jgi:phosphatidate cytidylyltransferase